LVENYKNKWLIEKLEIKLKASEILINIIFSNLSIVVRKYSSVRQHTTNLDLIVGYSLTKKGDESIDIFLTTTDTILF
jgi:hypothetical protein